MKRDLITAWALIALAGSAAAQTHNPADHHQPPPTAPDMRQGGMTHGQTGQAAPQSEATKAYMVAMDKMHSPMMEAIQDRDPDAAFVKGMIPHHQGAIDMAKVVLQYGKDEQAKKWANDVIREQQREIAEMQTWLKKRSQ